jgi:lipopolysaccharide export LptBFGC system permease protein LptF
MQAASIAAFPASPGAGHVSRCGSLMRTLHRYLLREMTATMMVAVLVCTGLLLVGNLLKEILTLLMAGQADIFLVLRGIALLIPYVLVYALPMAALTAALLVFGRFSSDNELTAARANGISLMSLAFPVIFLCLLLCGLCAWINMEVAPRCRIAYKSLFLEIARRSPALIPAGRFVTQFPGYVIYADRVTSKERGQVLELEDVLFFEVRNGRKVQDARVERRPEQNEIRLTFHEGRVLQWFEIESDSTNEVAETPSGFWQPLAINPFHVTVQVPPDLTSERIPQFNDMTWRQLWAERDELRKLGIEEVTPLDVQLHRQVAFSFACFGFALVGIPLGVRAHRKETSVGVAVAIALVLIYYGFLIVAQALETRPEAAPWMIVWMPNMLFQLTGAWLLWRVNRSL